MYKDMWEESKGKRGGKAADVEMFVR